MLQNSPPSLTGLIWSLTSANVVIPSLAHNTHSGSLYNPIRLIFFQRCVLYRLSLSRTDPFFISGTHGLSILFGLLGMVTLSSSLPPSTSLFLSPGGGLFPFRRHRHIPNVWRPGNIALLSGVLQALRKLLSLVCLLLCLNPYQND